MENALQSGKLKGEDREEMIRYTIFGFARIYDEDPLERIKPWVMMQIVLTIVALGCAGVIAMRHSGSIVPLVSAIGAIGMVIFALLYWVTTHSPRKRVRTWLAKALVPINPTKDEFRKSLREMQASRMSAGDRICCEKVLAKMNKLRANAI